MPIIVDPIATHARARGDVTAIRDMESGRAWTYAELHAAVDRAAGWLVAKLGPASGERVGVLSRNCAELLLLHLACVRAGAIFVPFNWRLAPAEIAQLIADAAPAMLFASADFDAPFEGERHAIDQLEPLTADSSPPPPEARRPIDAPATLLYTSGTSGRPKGVIVTEANAFWGNTNFMLGHAVTPESVFLCDMPLFHTAGLFAASRVPLLMGATLLISKGFDPETVLRRIADPALGVTHYFAVPQMVTMLWQAPGFDSAILARLTALVIGGAPNPRAQTERLASLGVPMSEGFGMSETGSNFAMPFRDKAKLIEKAGSAGLPLLTIRHRIVDGEGRDLPAGETGELWIAGPSVTPGYWNQPELTAAAFEGEWFKTGDAAMRDADGFLYLVDRKKDMFISGGENVYPAEIEAALAELPAVAQAAVIGVPDDRWGEVGWAYVIPRDGHALESEAVLAHCRTRLARYKVPARVVITDRIESTASGKVQKHLLRVRALADL